MDDNPYYYPIQLKSKEHYELIPIISYLFTFNGWFNIFSNVSTSNITSLVASTFYFKKSSRVSKDRPIDSYNYAIVPILFFFSNK
jgi:hypothetical protein